MKEFGYRDRHKADNGLRIHIISIPGNAGKTGQTASQVVPYLYYK